MDKDTLTIRRHGDDGYKIITVRLRENTLKALDRLADEANYSRNELINRILEHGIETLKIEA